EHEKLRQEKKELNQLIKEEPLQWARISDEIGELKKSYGPKTELGRRRTMFDDAPGAMIIPLEAMVEREPVTVICSAKGWIRSMKGHVEDSAEIKFKEGDRAKFHIQCETADKLVVFGTNGKFYTLGVDKLPGGRGHGEPIRLMIDLGNDQDIVDVMIHRPGTKLLVAAHDGRGFIVPSDDIVAQTRAGKQVLVLGEGGEAALCVTVPDNAAMLANMAMNRQLRFL